MAQRVYLETTIPSYLTAWPSRDLIVAGHQQVTKEWWRTRRSEFELCISQFVVDEASAGDAEAARERMAILDPLPLLDISEAVLELANDILQNSAQTIAALKHLYNEGMHTTLAEGLKIETDYKIEITDRAEFLKAFEKNK